MRLEWVKVVGIKHSSLYYWDVSRSILCWANIKHVRERMCTSSLSLCMHSCLSLLAQVTRPRFVPTASRMDNPKRYILNCPCQGAAEGLAAALWRKSLITLLSRPLCWQRAQLNKQERQDVQCISTKSITTVGRMAIWGLNLSNSNHLHST